MNILLIAIGSHGDVHPFVGLSKTLSARGHGVTLAANDYFRPLIEREGISFISLGTEAEYLELASEPDLWHPTRAFELVFRRGALPLMQGVYNLVLDRRARGLADIVVAHPLALGARVAEERQGVPLVTLSLSPAIHRSAIDPPKFSQFSLPAWMPRWAVGASFAMIDRLVVDRVLGPPVNAFRASVGLNRPVRGILRDWWLSPTLTVALFPEWFAPRPADWPMSWRQADFPLYDERGVAMPDPAMMAFLDQAGAAPIAFTPGSAMFFGQAFFAAAASACAAMGRRGILLSRHRAHVPSRLPAGVRHFEYAPFSELLPRCAALVHHGGIGTTAQALAAGIPQLIMPMAHDQRDNAARVSRLGAGDMLIPRRFTAKRIAQALAHLTESEEVRHACDTARNRCGARDGLSRACELIESACPLAPGMAA